MEKINFKFIKGDTYSRGFTIEGFDYAINQVYFTVKSKTSDKNYVIQKTLTRGIEQDTENPKRYILTIEADDTNDLKVNYDYVFDIQIVGDSVKKTIIGGYLKLEDWNITSKENEV